MTKDEELNIIKADDPSKTYENIAEMFSLTKNQVRYIFKKHKVKKKSRTSKVEDLSEDAIKDIIDNKDSFSFSYFEKKYNVTEKVLRNLFKAKGITKVRVKSFSTEKEWTPAEVSTLIENYRDLSNTELCGLLPNRSERAISKKLYSLELYRESPWSLEELELLKKYSYLPYDNLAFLLERSSKAIKHKYQELNLISKHSETSVETFIRYFLETNKISFNYNTQLVKEYRYRPDFCIEGLKILIEVQGDYWHANPDLYDDEDCTLRQIASREKDLLKKSIYESLGYTVIYIWESDIKNNPKNVIRYLTTLLCQEGPLTIEM